MRLTLALLTLLSLLVAPAAASAADLPLDVRGVKAEQVGGKRGVEIRFAPRAKALYKRIAGRKVQVDCTTVPPVDGPVLVRDDQGDSLSIVLRAPKRKRVLVLGRSAGGYDTCRIEARRTRTRKRTVETMILLNLGLPLTQRGAVFLDESEMLLSLDALLEAAKPAEGKTAYRTAAAAIERSGFSNVVALDDPAATPPAGKLGLYSDAAQHAAAVGVTKSGRRVFVDVNADALSTNLSTVAFSRG